MVSISLGMRAARGFRRGAGPTPLSPLLSREDISRPALRKLYPACAFGPGVSLAAKNANSVVAAVTLLKALVCPDESVHE